MDQSFDTFTVNKQGGPFTVVLVLAIFAFVGTVGTFLGLRMSENNRTTKACRAWTVKILHGAKADKLEPGVYVATLPTNDPWDTAYASNLTVSEFSNVVIVSSAGRDMEFGTRDDFNIGRTDLHKRKIIGAALKEGSRSVGHGLAQGMIEGVSEATDAATAKAKAGIAHTKSKLMGHFKKKKNDGDD